MAPGRLAELEALNQSGYPADSTRLWKSAIPEALEDDAFVDEHAAAVAAIALSWATGGESRLSRDVRAALRGGLTRAGGALARALAAAAVRVAPTYSHGRSSPQVALRVLSLMALGAAGLDADASAKPLTRLLEVAAGLLRRLGEAGWHDRRWRRVRAQFSPALLGVAERASEGADARLGAALEAVTKLASAGLPASAGAAALARLVADVRSAAAATPEAQAALSAAFAEAALSAREAPPQWALRCWAHVPWSEASLASLASAGARGARRSPEAALPGVAAALAGSGPALSGAALAELAPAVLAAVRHARPAARRFAAEAVVALAARAPDADALSRHLATPLLEPLQPSGAQRLKVTADRVALLQVLALVASAAPTEAAAGAAPAILPGLVKLLPTETAEDCRAAAAVAIGRWAAVAGSLDAGVAKALGAVVADAKEKDGSRVGAARALALALASPAAASSAAAVALLPQLASLISTGSAKATLRAGAVQATLAAARALAAGAAPPKELPKALEDAAAKAFAEASVARLACEDAEAAAEAVAVLVPLDVKLSPAARDALVAALSQLQLHHAGPVRRAARRAARDLVERWPQGARALLDALAARLTAAGPVPGACDATAEDADLPERALPSRAAAALAAALPRAECAAAAATPELALAVAELVETPIVRAYFGSFAPVAAVAAIARLPGLRAALAADPGAAAALAVRRLVASESGTPSRVRALGAVRALAAVAPDQAAAALLDELAPLLDPAAHDALSPRELRCWFCPAGRLSNEAEDGSVLPGEIFEALLQQEVERGWEASIVGSGSSSKLAVTPAAPPAAATGAGAGAAKPGAKPGAAAPSRASARPSSAGRSAEGPRGGRGAPGKDAAVVARVKQLAAEAEVRARVSAVVDALSCGSLGLASVARGAPETFLSTGLLTRALALIAPLAGSPLVGPGPVAATLVAFASTLGSPLSDSAATLGGSLRAALAEDARAAAAAPDADGDAVSPRYDLIASRSQLARSLGALCRAGGVARPEGEGAGEDAAAAAAPAAASVPLPPNGFAMLLPVLRYALASREAGLANEALALVAGQIAAGAVPPASVAPAVAALLLSLEAVPAQRAQATRLVYALADALPVGDADALAAVAAGALSSSAAARAATARFLGRSPAAAGGRLGELAAADPAAAARPLALLWLLRYDDDEEVAAVAADAWEAAGATLPSEVLVELERLGRTSDGRRRAAAARAAAGALEGDLASETEAALSRAFEASSAAHPQPSRLAALTLLRAAAALVPPAELPRALDAVLLGGVNDADAGVRAAALAAAEAFVDSHGTDEPEALLARLEAALEATAEDAAPRPAASAAPARAAAPAGGLVLVPRSRGGDSLSLSRGGRGGAAAAPAAAAAPTAEQLEAEAAAADRRDAARAGVVVLLGALAPYLPPDHPRSRALLSTLLDVLSTPSEAVQRGVSDRLPALVKRLSADDELVASTVSRLIEDCLRGDSYAKRRGAAYGLAGVVRGLGIGSLRQRGVLDALKAALEDPKAPNGREGALMAYECLSARLGRLFEPYAVAALPQLLAALGDSAPGPRAAASGAAQALMGQLSAQGVRLVLPSLLRGLSDRAWRTQEGSAQMLGAMAHCAPRQLGSCLPQVVPALAAALSDPHPRVSAASRAALDEVGSVIQNPEVLRLVPSLLACIADPSANARRTLDQLLATVFVNTADVASLALVVPVALRGLRDRSGDSKKRAARVVGTLCIIADDPSDMLPYLVELVPALMAATGDPLPEVRAAAARALGAVVDGLGADAVPDLTENLLEALSAEGSGVERAGAAQALAEVLAVRGEGAIAETLPVSLARAGDRLPAAREGALTLLRYLPQATPELFRPHLAEALPAVLRGLADEAEGVRDAALLAARVAVDLYARSALDLLLPAVEAGVASANWRIRQSSVELLGDLLFRVAGTSGKVQQDLHDAEGEGLSVEAHGRAIVDALGWDRRCEVLALVYLARSDAAYGVRSAALHVWKTIVVNTPKTLGEVLPALMRQVIGALADAAEDRRDAAGRCLGELVRKMGERVLVQIVPILRDGVDDPDAGRRQGVCNGLRDVVENATREQLGAHARDLLPAVQRALCDEDPAVRAAAGGAFGALYHSLGPSGVDAVVPALLSGLEGEDGEGESRAAALDGLRVLLAVRPALLGAMLPRLVRPPLRPDNLRALGALAEAAGSALPGHLATALPPLLRIVREHPDTSPLAGAAHDTLRRVVLSVPEDGLHVLMAELLDALADPELAVGAAAAVATLCRGTRLDFQEHVPALLTALVPMLSDPEDELVRAAWDAVSAVAGSTPKETQPSYVRCLKDAVGAARDREKRRRRGEGADPHEPVRVAGFCLPRGLQPVLPIYLQGVLQGSSSELRELAAEGIGELVDVTSPEALRPFVVQITGPLIRIVGDRFPWQIKAAILRTLGLLIDKAGVGLKPFVPQLQATFTKCLLDPEARVRDRAAADLGALAALSPRVDALVTDLANSARAAEPRAAEAYVAALRGALVSAGERLAPATLARAGEALSDAAQRAGDDEVLRGRASDAIGAWAACAPEAEVESALVAAGALGRGLAAQAGVGDRLGAALVAAAVLRRAPDRVTPQVAEQLSEAVSTRFLRDPATAVREAAAVSAGRLAGLALGLDGSAGAAAFAGMLPRAASALVALLGSDQHLDVQRRALAAVRRLAVRAEEKDEPETLAPLFPELVPSVLRFVQDSSGSSKLLAERALARLLGSASRPDLAVDFVQTQSAGSLPGRMLTDAYLRRLAKLPASDEGDDIEV